MKKRIISLFAMAALTLAACDRAASTSTDTSGQTHSDNTTVTAQTKPDNTAVNDRDKAGDAKTAGVAGQTKSDVEVAANIRRRIMDAKLSVNAQNCKVVVLQGKVTLRGPVKDQAESDSIAKAAGDVVGLSNVDNQLEITPNP